MSAPLSAVENAGKRLQNVLDNAKNQDLDQLVHNAYLVQSLVNSSEAKKGNCNNEQASCI